MPSRRAQKLQQPKILHQFSSKRVKGQKKEALPSQYSLLSNTIACIYGEEEIFQEETKPKVKGVLEESEFTKKEMSFWFTQQHCPKIYSRLFHLPENLTERNPQLYRLCFICFMSAFFVLSQFLAIYESIFYLNPSRNEVLIWGLNPKITQADPTFNLYCFSASFCRNG